MSVNFLKNERDYVNTNAAIDLESDSGSESDVSDYEEKVSRVSYEVFNKALETENSQIPVSKSLEHLKDLENRMEKEDIFPRKDSIEDFILLSNRKFNMSSKKEIIIQNHLRDAPVIVKV
jgi:hypothetical protein